MHFGLAPANLLPSCDGFKPQQDFQFPLPRFIPVSVEAIKFFNLDALCFVIWVSQRPAPYSSGQGILIRRMQSYLVDRYTATPPEV